MSTNNSPIMSMAERFRTAREHALLTQKALADQVGCSQPAINKLETGKSKSSRNTVEIAIICGVDPVWLEKGLGEMVTDEIQTAVCGNVAQKTDIASHLPAMEKQIERINQELMHLKQQVQRLRKDL